MDWLMILVFSVIYSILSVFVDFSIIADDMNDWDPPQGFLQDAFGWEKLLWPRVEICFQVSSKSSARHSFGITTIHRFETPSVDSLAHLGLLATLTGVVALGMGLTFAARVPYSTHLLPAQLFQVIREWKCSMAVFLICNNISESIPWVLYRQSGPFILPYHGGHPLTCFYGI